MNIDLYESLAKQAAHQLPKEKLIPYDHASYTRNLVELVVRECMDNLAWHGHDEAVSQLEWFKVNKLGIK